MEHCIRGDGEEIRNFLHRIKRTVDNGWPDDMNGIEAAQQNAEREAQGRQRRQRVIDYSLKRLRPRYLQSKAQEYLVENPNATWNESSTRLIQRDVSFQVSSNFLIEEQQTKAQMATLGQEMENLRSELQEHRVNAVGRTTRPVDPSEKGKQKATQFCNYCRTNVHTPSWCRKKIRDEEVKLIENERTAEKNVTFTQDYNKKLGPDQGSGQGTRDQDFQRRNQNYNNDGSRRSSSTTHRSFTPRPNLAHSNTVRTTGDHMINAQISRSKDTMEIDLEMDVSTTRMGTGETMETFPVLHRLIGETTHKIIPIANQEETSQTIPHSEDLTIDLRLALRPMNKNSLRTINIHHRRWFASPQPTIPLLKYQIFAR